MNEKKRQ